MKVGAVPFAAIDFESAGTGPGLTDEPVQIAVVQWHEGRAITTLNSHLKPTRPVTWAAREVHGISEDLLQTAPRLIDLWPQVKEALQGHWVVAHNAATEKRFLRVFPFHGFGPWVDTLPLVRAVYPTLASHALGDAILALGLETQVACEGFRWHDAASDARATIVLLRHLIDVAGIADEPAEILTKPDLSGYFNARRLKSRKA